MTTKHPSILRTAALFNTAAEAGMAGYAEFNGNPHLAVDVPDGGFTITAKTSEGKRITFAFQPYRNGGPPQCVDVCYHDNGTADVFGGNSLPTFDVLAFGRTKAKEEGKHDSGDRFQLDTRKNEFKPGIVCVLMDGKEEAK